MSGMSSPETSHCLFVAWPPPGRAVPQRRDVAETVSPRPEGGHDAINVKILSPMPNDCRVRRQTAARVAIRSRRGRPAPCR